MAEVLALRLGSWVTAMAIEHLVEYFSDSLGQGVGKGIGKWSKTLKEMIASAEEEAIQGMHNDMHVGMAALSASISAVNQETKDGTKAVLDKLVELRESQHHDQQLANLQRAVDAIGDLTSHMYAPGNPKNIFLLEKASKSAEEAARSTNGNFLTKLQAFRLWVVTEYMHEVTTANGECTQAKMTALNILGRVIIKDKDIIEICRKYSSPRSFKEATAPELVTPEQPEETGWPSWSEDEEHPEGLSETMDFLFDITSSVSMLPPLDREVTCRNLITTGVSGSLTLGPDVPHDVIFAMGRYCATNSHLSRAYAAVSAVALEAWDAGKEKLALDNFFVSMSGNDWFVNRGWAERTLALGDRFGVTLEDGHVTKLILATNNLRGCLSDDMVDCEHLRELVLHGNNIFGGVPPRLQGFIDGKPEMVVTGLPGRGVTCPPLHSLETSNVFRPGVGRRPFTIPPSAASSAPTPRVDNTTPGHRSFLFLSSSGKSTSRPEHSSSDISIPPNGQKKKSLFKKASKFIKTAMALNFGAGDETSCPECGGKTTPIGSQRVCRRCNPGDPQRR